jgi:hypothetical protein
MKRISITGLLLAVLMAVPALAGANKTGGAYRVLMDAINARGGYSSGGSYAAFSSIGQRTSSIPRAAGSFEVISGFIGAIDTTAPTLTISSPTTATAATSTVPVAGTAFDQNDLQWTVYMGPGASPASWTQVAAGAGNQASSYSFGSWDSSNYSGSYTMALVAVDGHGNIATGTVTFSAGGALTITGTIPAFKWMFLGIPGNVNAADPVSLFGTSGEYKVYRWEPAATSEPVIDRYRYPTALNAGQGFWIKSYGADLPYSFSAAPTDTTGGYTLALESGWNQISVPYNDTFSWGGVQVSYNGNTYDLTTAANMGLISDTSYMYDNTSNSWTPVDSSGTMVPQLGHYCRAYQNIALVFDPGRRTLRTPARRMRQTEDYRLNIAASAGGVSDPHNILASADTADAEYDPNDAEQPPSALMDNYIDLYFDNTAWGAHPGRYAADVRPLARAAGHAESWPLTVDTTQAGQQVSLSWDNAALPSTRFSFTLVDLTAGTRTDMAAQGSYAYTAGTAGMDGITQNRFRVEIVKLLTPETTVTYTLEPGWNLMSAPVDPEVTGALEQLGDDLPLLQVYQFFDGQYYAGAEADIQAGAGYWVHVDKSAEIDISGMPVPEGRPLTLPLKTGWNLIGNPFQAALAWDDSVTFTCAGQSMPLSQALAAGHIAAGPYLYQGDAYAPLARDASLQPWKGYMLKTTADCDMTIMK